MASHHPFHFSADNLESNNSTSKSFQLNVQHQVESYLKKGLPKEADLWTKTLLNDFRPNNPLQWKGFKI